MEPEAMEKALDDIGLKPNERAALAELRDGLRELLGERLVKFVLFGSKARGESDEESDIDVLLVIRDFDKEKNWDEWNELEDLAFEIGRMRHGIAFNTIEYSQSDYEFELRHEYPLIANIEREGIPL